MKALIIFIVVISLFSTGFAQDKWQGVDEAVIEKFASEKGKQVKEPLIPLEGDTELFVFAVFSAIGGFIAGYYWRQLLQQKKKV